MRPTVRFFSSGINKCKRYILQQHFNGFPKETDFKLVVEDIPALKDGEFLAEAVYLSVDPYMRAYIPRYPTGITMIGSQVAKIIDSKNPKFPAGKYISGQYGWRTHTISNGQYTQDLNIPERVLPDYEGLPVSLALGALGMPGNTAYFGLLEICKPKPGETVVITGAAGAVGSHVGQIAKIKGCNVIGIAGSEEKGKWLLHELNFDHFINYKRPDFTKNLVRAAPNGIDCYFDNVGGEISSKILNKMNKFGRVSVCGAISGYNDKELPKATIVQYPLVSNQLKMEGFVVDRWVDRWFEGVKQNLEWIKEGKLKPKETVYEGFENMFAAFTDMLRGGNLGKAVVKV